MKLGIFYQMWHQNQRAAYESLKQLRKVYPTQEIVLQVTGVYRKDLEKFKQEFLELIQAKFNITKVVHLHKDDFIGYFHPQRTIYDLLLYNDALLDYTFNTLEEGTDFMLFGSEDLYVFKQIPIDPLCDICCNPREWDSWMNTEAKNIFNYSVTNKILWFQHGHYLNLKKFKQVFTPENRKYISDNLAKLYPNSQSIYSDYFTSIWSTFACTNYKSVYEYLIELPSEVSNETPFETFERTNCYARHGYKALYNQKL